MVPAYLEQLAGHPRDCPAARPTARACPRRAGPAAMAAAGDHSTPATGTEQVLAETLAKVLAVDRVSADSTSSTELGASSLLMALFSAALREHGGLPPVSMKDIYLHPTVRRLAATLAGPGPARELPEPAPGLAAAAGAPSAGGPAARGTPAYLAVRRAAAARVRHLSRRSDPWRWTRGLPGPPRATGRSGSTRGWWSSAEAGCWPWAGADRGQMASRSAAGSRGAIRAWSLAYVRFWIVKTLIVANPLARLFVGTPLYSLYLRALGARIGRRVVILTQHVPVVHRPADDRRGQRDPQGHVPQRLPGPGGHHRDRRHHPGRGRVRRRAHGPRHRHRPR